MATTFLTLIFDLVVFILTLTKTYRHIKDMQEFKQISIAEVILRDGQYLPNFVAISSCLLTWPISVTTGTAYFLSVGETQHRSWNALMIYCHSFPRLSFLCGSAAAVLSVYSVATQDMVCAHHLNNRSGLSKCFIWPLTYLVSQSLGSGAAFFLLLHPYTIMCVGLPSGHAYRAPGGGLLTPPLRNIVRIPTMLISRLYLNLRTFQDGDSDNAVSPHAHSALKFASTRILGNIGAPLNSLDGSEEEVEYPCDGEVDEHQVIGGSHADSNDLGRSLTIDNGVAQDTTLLPVVRSSFV